MLLLAVSLAVTAVIACEDVEGFEDEKGYECEDWDKWGCDKAVEWWKYSAEGEVDLLKNCCATCKRNVVNCQDDKQFEDEDGYSCRDWWGYSCYQATTEYGYSVKGTTELLAKCVDTCESCAYEPTEDCKDDHSFKDEEDYACGDWQEYECGDATSEYEYSKLGLANLLKSCPYTCGTCGYGENGCVDDKLWKDEEGYICAEWTGYDCDEAVTEWDYSPAGQAALKQKCKFTCKTCGDGKGDEGGDDSSDDEPDQIDFEGYQALCENSAVKKETCVANGCKYKAGKNGKSAKCFQKKEKKVKCKKITNFLTCLRIGCDAPEKDGGKCSGKPF